MNLQTKSFFPLQYLAKSGACLLLTVFCMVGWSQTMSVNNQMLVDYYRSKQLIDIVSSPLSLCVLPSDDAFIVHDSILQKLQYYKPVPKLSGSFYHTGLIPLSITQKYNSHHPYGWNSGSMMAASGYQVQVTTGFFIKAGILQLQLQPEWVYAANPRFTHNNAWGSDDKKGSYQKLFPGQSDISLNLGAVSLSVSTRNLWWGPGIYNSLMMSNNAPGFLHASFHSNKPLKTPIGSFEWQLIAGKLVEDTNVMLENKNLSTAYYNPQTYDGGGTGAYDPAKKWRYLSAVTLTYNPKWISGLFVGITRVGYAYNDNVQKGGTDILHDYFPVLFGVFRQNYAYGNDTASSEKRYKQMFSLHAKYIFIKSHLELHAEYGWDDNSYNVRDLLLDIPHAAAFTLGLKKMWQLTNKNWLDVQAEVTQLAQTNDYLVRNSGYWYLYQGGYTNQSRIIGAGIGPGNNVQTLAVSLWRKGLNKMGFKILKLQHDPSQNDASAPLITLGLRPANWTDAAFGFTGNQLYKRFLLSGEMQLVTSRNYCWQAGINRVNFYGNVTLSYLW